MKIKYKLIISYLFLIIFAVSILGLITAEKSKNAVLKQLNEKSQRLTESISTTLSVRHDLLMEKSYGDLNFANTILDGFNDLTVDYSQSIRVGTFDLPVLYAGKQSLSLDETVVDKLKRSTGTAATILLLHDNKFIRVSTTICKDGKRIEGTYISSDSAVYKKLINKQEYYGNIIIDGTAYVTRMEPLQDKYGKVVGAIGIGNIILNNFLENTLSNIKIGETGYAYILDSEGNVVMHPYDKGKNVKQLDFVKKMHSVQKGTIDYTYNGVRKVAYYQYFEPWQWYIVTTANYDELNSSYKSIWTTTAVVGGLIIVLGGIVAIILANNLVEPIDKLKHCMEIASEGDLSVHCDIESNDEIGILSNSFNNMIAENKRLLEETVQYDKLKTEFIANMSHELRTPLNIIFSTAQLFNIFVANGEYADTDKMKKYTNSIKQNCYRLLRLVNNLIDMTKLDSGFMNLDLKNYDIVQVAEEITQSTAGYVQTMSRTIIFDTDVEEKIMAFDCEKLERILLNLISNATKFTEPGDTIEVSLFDKGDFVIISVKDNGIGIPEEKLPQLFERFKQVDPLLSRSHEGSGIGLSIVKAMVEMHGGTIEVSSKYGEETEFTICLPSEVILESDSVEVKEDFTDQSNVEKIKIEFSDIYN